MHLLPIVKQSTRSIFTSYAKVQKHFALEGIKVIDLTRIVAGPYCTMLLSDLGADVIKIEQPGFGDEARRWGPFIDETQNSCYFIALNRNKKSVCVNLKSERGRNIVIDLAKKCDILIENYVPGKLDKLGLGYSDLRNIAPHLIYCSITGFGERGPYKLRPGFDVVAASYGGLLHITGPKCGDPVKSGVPMTDIATGLYAYGSIMTALLEQRKTGVGQKINCNLLSTQISCLINVATGYLNANQNAERLGTAHSSIVPYETFRTADGFLTIGAGSNEQFINLCKVLSLDHLITDSRFANNSLRKDNREVLVKVLKDKLASKTTKEWLTVLEGSPFPYGPVYSIPEVFDDEHVKEIELVKDMLIRDENNKPVKIKVVGPAVEFSGSKNEVRSPPPELGQHTSEVLKGLLNYSDHELERMMRNGDIS